MRPIVLLAALAVAFSAWAQAPEKKAEPKQAAAEENKVPEKMVVKIRFTEKRFEDARHCLERPTNVEIIKCAEEYL